ncbi:hypothetical protein P3T18_006802 [Paraburkholderia sp. GAS199]|uniref:hypothetical protein n=1 Tax=Paraburkholderia sp. GAS199 TaxID=3035126 RepID=UPI003D232D66
MAVILSIIAFTPKGRVLAGWPLGFFSAVVRLFFLLVVVVDAGSRLFFLYACGGGVFFLIGLLVLPLCGAAPTFLCSGKEK